MNKKRITAAIAAVMIAGTAMTTAAYAETENVFVTMDNPFADCFEKQDDGTWAITARGAKFINTYEGEDGGVFNLHVTLKDRINDSMIWHFEFKTAEKTYSLDYILMIPVYSAEEGANLYLPIKDILTALSDQYNGEKIPFDKIESGTISDSLGLIKDIEVTAKTGFPALAGHTWITYTKDKKGEYTVPSKYFVFDDETSGHTVDCELGIGLPFTYEQDDNNATFWFGSPDEGVPANFTTDGVYLYASISYDEAGEYTQDLRFDIFPGEVPEIDPEDTGEIDLPVFYEIDNNRWELYNAEQNLNDANGTAGGNVGIIVKYDDVLADGMDLDFILYTKDGPEYKVCAKYDVPLSTDTVFIKVRDLIRESGLDIDDIVNVHVLESGSGHIADVSFGMGSSSYAEMRFASSDVLSAADDGENPKTGVFTCSAAALISGAAVLLASKKRR